jgi:2'-5' RNA ligase
MRVFFALWPNSSATRRLAEVAAGLTLPGHARVVPRENYHATLMFVGEVASSQLDALQRIGAARSARHCTIEFDALEYWSESRVVVASAHDVPSSLEELWIGLRHDLLAQGLIAGEGAALRLHVTLARKVAQAPVLKAMSPFSWSVQAFSLVRSDTSGAQSIYTVLDTWPLLYETSHP